ncbi:hypothetical protein L249_0905 [Ophiocordyceps polyrhachis-furcata BCC 54312]|uniref:Uncharacterized protein n=1 Tax=Ophiocordyceps polyrhachis-furcata BCC 54312 TaxID=1330021 RepID=A0A367LCP3_9HYPO|nr:hypothetical protein L249_0905 [Ophiocordyceps polyrhachis-furcata BCC 54312]
MQRRHMGRHLRYTLNLLLSEWETLRAVTRSVDRLVLGVDVPEKADKGTPLPLLLLRKDFGKLTELPYCRRGDFKGCGLGRR